jgi:hypothetical protein
VIDSFFREDVFLLSKNAINGFRFGPINEWDRSTVVAALNKVIDLDSNELCPKGDVEILRDEILAMSASPNTNTKASRA